MELVDNLGRLAKSVPLNLSLSTPTYHWLRGGTDIPCTLIGGEEAPTFPAHSLVLRRHPHSLDTHWWRGGTHIPWTLIGGEEAPTFPAHSLVVRRHPHSLHTHWWWKAPTFPGHSLVERSHPHSLHTHWWRGGTHITCTVVGSRRPGLQYHRWTFLLVSPSDLNWKHLPLLYAGSCCCILFFIKEKRLLKYSK